MTVEEIEEADARSEEFADLLNAIESKPDAAARFDELRRTMRELAEEFPSEIEV